MAKRTDKAFGKGCKMETPPATGARPSPVLFAGSAVGQTPFTVEADLELGDRISAYLVDQDGDVVVREGAVPERLPGEGPDGAAYQVRGGRMLLTVPNGLRYLVEDGQTITYARDERHGDRDVALFLLGSAWAALCFQRGLVPLHTSAVSAERGVYAFTGPSGAGKSTLAAALTALGHEFFTDDVVILDPERFDPEPWCFSAQRDLKLWGDAVTMTGSARGDTVRDAADYDKYYVSPHRRSEAVVAPFAALFVLDATPGRPSIEPIVGGEALLQFAAAVYRPAFATAILGRRRLYEILGGLAKKVPVLRFRRPFEEGRFAEGAEFIAAWIAENG